MPLNEREQVLAGQRDRAEAECERLREEMYALIRDHEKKLIDIGEEHAALGVHADDPLEGAKLVREMYVALRSEYDNFKGNSKYNAEHLIKSRDELKAKLAEVEADREKIYVASGGKDMVLKMQRDNVRRLEAEVERLREIIRVVEANNRGRCDYCGCAPHVDCALEAVVRKPEGD